jgi:(4-(4-[2-(gamma-L-glutamylamino)ethyl]phenoxymethyl)furan-2-yl)methanamine synthase
MRRDVLALDVGGANIKAADGTGWTHAEPFAMWRDAPRLSEVLTRIIRDAGPRRIVATMTGEIADCFADRRAGVEHIVRALAAAAAACGCGLPGIYRVDSRIVPPDEAVADPLAVAASNWHAVARLAASLVPAARGLLVDIGSTTTDIVPLVGGRPAPLATDDPGRMATGELVYTGVERTPVPAIVRGLPYRGVRRPVASERFAESRDAWLVLGGLAEDPASRDTADGGPFTRDASRIRLARTMLLEPGLFTADDAERAAGWIAAAQARQVARALDRVARASGGPPEALVCSGHGERLARMAFDRLGWSVAVVSLPAVVGAAVARSAPAHALAAIARGELA